MSPAVSPTSISLTASPRYEEVVEYLFGRINYERVPTSKYSNHDFQLPRMSLLLERLGNPQLSIPAVHITGTKGKGSTAAMTAAMLQSAGHRVGLFTSPHLLRFEERMTVNGEMPSEKTIVTLVDRLRALAADLEGSDETRPTFFELSTALAWMVFQSAGCGVAVLEVGLGGRLDTTNLCCPLVTVITSISRDHMKLLGDTLELIAQEKAGIIKEGVDCITGVDQPTVLQVIEEACRSRGATLLKLGDEIRIERPTASKHVIGPQKLTVDVRTPRSHYAQISVPLAGEYQARNAALAVAAVEIATTRLAARPVLGGERPDGNTAHVITGEEVRQGLSQVSWPLRLEVVNQHPLIILDAAHNDASIRELCRAVEPLPCRIKTLIFGTSRDKEARSMLSLLGKTFDRVVITKYSTNPRAWPVDDLHDLACPLVPVPVSSIETVAQAIEITRSQCSSDDLICIAGSFFLAAESRGILVRQSALPEYHQ